MVSVPEFGNWGLSAQPKAENVYLLQVLQDLQTVQLQFQQLCQRLLKMNVDVLTWTRVVNSASCNQCELVDL